MDGGGHENGVGEGRGGLLIRSQYNTTDASKSGGRGNHKNKSSTIVPSVGTYRWCGGWAAGWGGKGRGGKGGTVPNDCLRVER